MTIVDTTNIEISPELFRQPDYMTYPSDNQPPFENWYGEQMIKNGHLKTERVYLCIYWTSYFKNNSYGEDAAALNTLQSYIYRLDTDRKYYTICQYDLGILVDLSRLDIKVFSMAGQPMDYPLPLISQPHKYNLTYNRIYTYCFIGAKTHPVREKILELPFVANVPSFISDRKFSLDYYCDILCKSVFSLCPRGFSGNSFRIQESLECGSIPVVISDDFHDPHNVPFDSYGIRIDIEDVESIPEILNSYSKEDILFMQMEGEIAYRLFYTFEANKELILKNI